MMTSWMRYSNLSVWNDPAENMSGGRPYAASPSAKSPGQTAPDSEATIFVGGERRYDFRYLFIGGSCSVVVDWDSDGVLGRCPVIHGNIILERHSMSRIPVRMHLRGLRKDTVLDPCPNGRGKSQCPSRAV